MTTDKRRCVRGCEPSHGPFFGFPRTEIDSDRRKVWLKSFGIEGWTPENLFACGKHFSEKQRIGNRLKRAAVPDLKLVNDQYVRGPSIDKQVFNSPALRNTEDFASFNALDENIRLRNEIAELKRKIKESEEGRKRLRLENESKSQEIASLREKTIQRKEDLLTEILSGLPPQEAIIIRHSISNVNKAPRGRRYGDDIKLISLQIFFLSPVAYRFLKNNFQWPSEKTLYDFVKDWPRGPGLDEFTLKTFQIRASGLTAEQRYVSISCDEMSLCTFLQYDQVQDLIYGLEDFGDENRTPLNCDNVLVFMVQSVGGVFWRQPLAYFFSNGPVPKLVVCKYLFELIEKLISIHFHPVHFVCNQGSNFYGLIKDLGVSELKPFFNVGSSKINVFFDSPHLLKSTRNCIYNSNTTVHFNGGEVNWSDIQLLFELSSNGTYKVAHSLTLQHLKLDNFTKQRVYLAAQVLSNKVGSGLNALYTSGTLPSSEARTIPNTASFALFFNELFDLFNSRNTESKSEIKSVFRATDRQIKFLHKAREFLKSIKISDKNGGDKASHYCWIKGWLLNISSLLDLWKDLSKEGFEYLATRKFCQDGLEHFFSEIRNRTNQGGKVSAYMFSKSYQKRWGLDYAQAFIESNCSVEEIEAGPFFENNRSTQCQTEKYLGWESLQAIQCPDRSFMQRYEFRFDEATELLEKNANTYVAGWFYSKFCKLHQCATSVPLEKQNPCFDMLKPPEGFLKYFKCLQSEFNSIFNSSCHRRNVSQFFFDHLKIVTPYNCCDLNNSDQFLAYFIRVKIFVTLRFYNREHTSATEGKKSAAYKQVLKLNHS